MHRIELARSRDRLILADFTAKILNESKIRTTSRTTRHSPRREAHDHKVQRISRLLIFKVLPVLVLDWYSLQYFRWIVLSLDRYSALFEWALAPCSASVSDPRQHCHTCCLRAGIWPTWARWHHEAARRLQPHQCGLIDANSR